MAPVKGVVTGNRRQIACGFLRISDIIGTFAVETDKQRHE
jgi:hypothetical protein